MRQKESKLRYLSYLLRLWETRDGDRIVWRASLERPGDQERTSFGSLTELIAYLEQRTQEREGETE